MNMNISKIKALFPGSKIESEKPTISVIPHNIFNIRFNEIIKDKELFGDKNVYSFTIKCNGDPDYLFENGKKSINYNVYDKNQLKQIINILINKYCVLHELDGFSIMIDNETTSRYIDSIWID